MKLIKLSLALLSLAVFFVVPSRSEVNIYKKGKLAILVPTTNFRATYLFDVIESQNIVGAETSFIRYDDFEGTIGFATNIDNENVEGIPFFGIDKASEMKRIRFGLFVGRDFRKGATIAGIKSSVKFW